MRRKRIGEDAGYINLLYPHFEVDCIPLIILEYLRHSHSDEFLLGCNKRSWKCFLQELDLPFLKFKKVDSICEPHVQITTIGALYYLFMHGLMGGSTEKTKELLKPIQDEIIHCDNLTHWAVFYDKSVCLFVKAGEVCYHSGPNISIVTSDGINQTIDQLIRQKRIILMRHRTGNYWGIEKEESACELVLLFKKYLPDFKSNTSQPTETK